MSYKHIPWVSVEEHKALIDTLSPSEYVYLFDGRYRSAITFDDDEKCFYVCACCISGAWVIIDSFHDIESVEPAFLACIHAVINSYAKGTLEHDLDWFGKVNKRVSRLNNN